MGDGGLHDQIEDLELQIEALAEATERCRKIAVASKLAIGLGGLLLAAVVVGAVRADAVALLGSITSMIGGVVVFGSNAGTEQQLTAKLDAAEALRAELISRIELRVVSAPALSS